MDIQQLRYFTTLAEHLHYTKAAEMLYISQPALSNAIKRMENELGAPLFIRKKTGVQLSEYGSILLPVAQNVIDEMDSVSSRIANIKELRRDSMRIIAPTSLINSKLMDILQHMNHDISFIVGNIYPAEVNRSLRSGEAQFCIYGYDLSVGNLPRMYLEDIPNYLTVHKTHPLAGRESLTLKDMENVPMITLHRGSVPRRELDDQFKKAGIKPLIDTECGDIFQVMSHKRMLEGKVALFGPKEPLERRIGDLSDFRFLRIKDSKFMRVLYWSPDIQTESEMFKEIKNTIVDFYRNKDR